LTLGNILMWAADVNLVFSYWLLDRKRLRVGFFLSVAGSLCFVVAGLLTHLPAIWAVNLLFMGINGWNFIKTYLDEPEVKTRRNKLRYAWFGD
jgi:hypothetical protein